MTAIINLSDPVRAIGAALTAFIFYAMGFFLSHSFEDDDPRGALVPLVGLLSIVVFIICNLVKLAVTP